MGIDSDYDDPQARPARRPRRAAQIDDAVAEDIQRRMAAMRTRYLCDQHGCQAHTTGSCDHPNHRRDLDLLNTMLAMLGMDQEYPAYTQTEHATWLKWLGQSGPPSALDDAA